MFVWQLSAWVQSCFSFSRSAVVVFPNAVFVVIFDVFALDRFRRSCPLYSFRFEGPGSGKRGDWGGKRYCYVGRCSRFRFDITFASNEGVNFIRTALCEFTTMSKIFFISTRVIQCRRLNMLLHIPLIFFIPRFDISLLARMLYKRC